jgi:hypothetical protein
MALAWSFYASVVTLLYYVALVPPPPGIAFYVNLAIFLVSIMAIGRGSFSIWLRIFRHSKGLGFGSSGEWALVVTSLGAAFATGAVFESVSTVGSQTVSTSSCISPAHVNVTSPNCVQIQTITQTQGTNVAFAQLGIGIIAVGIVGALAFGVSYFAIRLFSEKLVES